MGRKRVYRLTKTAEFSDTKDNLLYEVWKNNPEYPNYLISSFGNILSKNTNKLVGVKVLDGYVKARLFTSPYVRKERFLHRIVAKTFIYFEGCDNFEINHIDGNKLNNKLDNLEWATRQQNQTHAWDMGLCGNYGEDCFKAKLTELQTIEIITKALVGKISYVNLAKEYNVDPTNISWIMRRKSWNHLWKKIDNGEVTIGKTI